MLPRLNPNKLMVSTDLRHVFLKVRFKDQKHIIRWLDVSDPSFLQKWVQPQNASILTPGSGTKVWLPKRLVTGAATCLTRTWVAWGLYMYIVYVRFL